MKRPAGRLFVLVDAHYRDDVRFLGLGNLLAELLYLRALAWSKAQNTDGRVPRVALERRLADDYPSSRRPDELAAELVDAGLWEVTDDGWRVPPERWARWQTTAEEQEDKRAAEAERKARYRARQAGPKPPRRGTRKTATSSPGGTESRATRSQSHSQSHSQSEITSSGTTSQSSVVPGACNDAHDMTTTDERVVLVARALAARDLERRESERADTPITQPARWLTVATNRRIESNGAEVTRLLADGMTPGRIVEAIAGIEAQAGSPTTAARARRAQANGAAR